MNKKIKLVLINVVAVGLLASAAPSIAEKINFRAIKPAKNQTVALSDEQQAILAIRKIKPAVVSIVSNEQLLGVEDYGEIDVPKNFGSGIIIESNGLILTNSHVVESEKESYVVITQDGVKYAGKLLGIDKYDDIALLKIDGKNLPVAELGDSSGLETGQSIFVLGNSLGKYQNSVTRGVVSGLGRTVNVDSSRPRFVNLIQTDASVNPGNSGGPMVDLLGRVIGISVAVDRGGEGLGFGIPINLAKDAVSQLKQFGKVSRAFLGITFINIDKAIQATKKLAASEGAYILAVSANGPSFGVLKKYDIIVSINQERISQSNELDTIARKYKPGDQIMINLIREGQVLELPLIFGEYK